MKELTGQPARKTAAALGYFDGVHVGHRLVLASAIREAERLGLDSSVFTFVFDAASPVKGSAILSAAERRRRIAAMGIDWYFCPHYREFCDLTPNQFVQRILIGSMNAASVFCGENFTFGRNRSGSVDLLKRLCGEAGIGVTVLPLAERNGQPVSSTLIRSLLTGGRMEEANELLCQPYTITEPVRHGYRIGTKLGFPTINQLIPNGMVIPKCGFYITRARVNGRWYPAATGLGSRPTFGGRDITCESTLVGFDGNLYGDDIRLEFFRFLGPTQKFGSADELKRKIAEAVSLAEAFFSDGGGLNG